MSKSVGIYSVCSFLLQLNSLTSVPQDPKLFMAMAELNRSFKGQFTKMAKKKQTYFLTYPLRYGAIQIFLFYLPRPSVYEMSAFTTILWR